VIFIDIQKIWRPAQRILVRPDRSVLSPLLLLRGVMDICIIRQFTADSFLKGWEFHSKAG